MEGEDFREFMMFVVDEYIKQAKDLTKGHLYNFEAFFQFLVHVHRTMVADVCIRTVSVN